MSGAGGLFIFYLLYLCSVLHYVVNVRVIFHPDLNHLQQPGCVAIKTTWTFADRTWENIFGNG